VASAADLGVISAGDLGVISARLALVAEVGFVADEHEHHVAAALRAHVGDPLACACVHVARE